jgi:hypothetical protein
LNLLDQYYWAEADDVAMAEGGDDVNDAAETVMPILGFGEYYQQVQILYWNCPQNYLAGWRYLLRYHQC